MRWLAVSVLAVLSLVFLLRRGAARSRRGAARRLRRLSGYARVEGKPSGAGRLMRAAGGWLASSRFAGGVKSAFEESGVDLTWNAFLALWLWSLPFAAVAAAAVTGSALSIPPAVCCVVILPRPLLKTLGRRRSRKVVERCEKLAADLALHLACGMPVEDAIRLCAPDAGQGLSGAIDRFGAAVALGAGAEAAFLNLAGELGSPDLDLIAHAVLTSRETGSDVRVVMAAVGEALRERAAIRRELQTQTVQGRLSGRIVAGLPLLFLGISLVVSRESFTVLFGTAPGLLMLGGAGVLDLLGFLWIKKILDMHDR